MKNLKNKKGISLIVLILTIIVMIILATAIILSLNNSGIIGKANKAKTASDTASLKEYVNVLQAEWELMSETERGDYDTSTEYVNAKLEAKGYTNVALSVDNELYTGLTESAREAITDGIKIGDEVDYNVQSNSTTSGKVNNGYSDQPILIEVGETDETKIIWRYIGVGANGELLIAPDMTSDAPKLTLKGTVGWKNGPDELDRICGELYSVTGKGTARSMNIDDVTRILGYTGENGSECYWYEYYPTTEAKKIGDIMVENSEFIYHGNAPESDKNLEDYYSNYYYISKTDDVSEMKNSKYINLVFPSSGSYWLASAYAAASRWVGSEGDLNGLVNFGLRFVTDSSVCNESVCGQGFYDALWLSNWKVDYGRYLSRSIRPVVSLTSKIQKSSDDSGTIWVFE